jgi:uncharacterized glyoxalase superfamily protein PhnB
MHNSGGKASTAHRREVDLYIHATGVDELHQSLNDRVTVVEPPRDTFYGMREFTIRDLNALWIMFGKTAG